MAPRQQQACIFHLQGRCRHGASCHFSHEEGAPRPPCAYFQRGSCRYGSDCLYAHEGTPSNSRSGRCSARGAQQTAGPAAAAAATSGKSAGAAYIEELQHLAASRARDSGSSCGSDFGEALKPLQCKVCDHTAANHLKLLRHLQRSHKGHAGAAEQATDLQQQRKCPACSTEFRSLQILSDHYLTAHIRPIQEERLFDDFMLDLMMMHARAGAPEGAYSEGEDEWDERAGNFGFTHDEVEELLCQGVKPWDEDAWDVLEFLRDPY
ncbi:hypothetical protein N2152v2_003468 [Parachlorella kessleri]